MCNHKSTGEVLQQFNITETARQSIRFDVEHCKITEALGRRIVLEKKLNAGINQVVLSFIDYNVESRIKDVAVRW